MEWTMVGVIVTLIVSVVSVMNGWAILLIRDLRADLRRQHQVLLAVLQGHTHDEDDTAMSQQLTESTD